MIRIPCCETKRLALALKSKISEGVSSINNGAFQIFNFGTQLFPFMFSSLPVRNFSDDKPVSEEIKRVINCTDAISGKTKQQVFHNLFLVDNTNAVLPIAGLAAIIIKSLGCQPSNFI
jgi:hypothetical protein